jgi:hypothetical protein
VFPAHGSNYGTPLAFRYWHLIVITVAVACGGEREGEVQTTPAQTDSFEVYERSLRSLRQRDVATSLGTHLPSERTRIDSMLESGAVTFEVMAKGNTDVADEIFHPDFVDHMPIMATPGREGC